MTLQEIQDLAGHRDVPPRVVKLVGDAVAKEREACAEICENHSDEAFLDGRINADHHAYLIRERGYKYEN
jgi:hypothetical protein